MAQKTLRVYHFSPAVVGNATACIPTSILLQAHNPLLLISDNFCDRYGCLVQDARYNDQINQLVGALNTVLSAFVLFQVNAMCVWSTSG